MSSRKAVVFIAWSKLVFIGLLLSFITLAWTARLLEDKAVWAALLVFLGWIGFLIVRFFYLTPNNDEDAERVPVTIITGFLGCGKTTLVNHILQNESSKRILVIENEIGDESIDHELLFRLPGGSAKEEVIVLSNGCVCCTVRGDLLRAMQELFKRPLFRTLDWILIETTVFFLSDTSNTSFCRVYDLASSSHDAYD